MGNLFKGSPYRRRRDKEGEAGDNRSTDFDHENPDDDNDASSPFDHDMPSTRNASMDRLRRCRQAALVLDASRRFRYALDLKREEEKRQI
ncbi:hypothetical protein K2173_011368 [Erythroxylum novogranatense]|uniref:Calcium-transporting P-type ATPase N-terminal autoinhibitory domain-containing protein n=1 Tax=Erythroxylum novogranatense TaxID=1862640 RepID=A0AAV8S9D5_9ROSI|nr:hypothetical protein K2173_011368 [Erythroxylum novogranatense]